jgi:hypothetical protein
MMMSKDAPWVHPRLLQLYTALACRFEVSPIVDKGSRAAHFGVRHEHRDAMVMMVPVRGEKIWIHFPNGGGAVCDSVREAEREIVSCFGRPPE